MGWHLQDGVALHLAGEDQIQGLARDVKVLVAPGHNGPPLPVRLEVREPEAGGVSRTVANGAVPQPVQGFLAGLGDPGVRLRGDLIELVYNILRNPLHELQRAPTPS